MAEKSAGKKAAVDLAESGFGWAGERRLRNQGDWHRSVDRVRRRPFPVGRRKKRSARGADAGVTGCQTRQDCPRPEIIPADDGVDRKDRARYTDLFVFAKADDFEARFYRRDVPAIQRTGRRRLRRTSGRSATSGNGAAQAAGRAKAGRSLRKN